jgi:hypothetical protein
MQVLRLTQCFTVDAASQSNSGVAASSGRRHAMTTGAAVVRHLYVLCQEQHDAIAFPPASVCDETQQQYELYSTQ